MMRAAIFFAIFNVATIHSAEVDTIDNSLAELMQHYVMYPASSKVNISTAYNYPAFTLSTQKTLTAISWVYYSSNNCSSTVANETVTTTGSVALNAGTYVANDASSYQMCSRIAVIDLTGCEYAFNIGEPDTRTNSFRVFYTAGGVTVSGDCHPDKFFWGSGDICTVEDCTLVGSMNADTPF